MKLTLLTVNTRKTINQGNATRNAENAATFYYAETPTEKGYRMMIEGLEIYCHGLLYEHGMTAGQDYYAQPYLHDIARALIGLASGHGIFDGGTIDRTVRAISDRYLLEVD
jgi:hypothetical protein